MGERPNGFVQTSSRANLCGLGVLGVRQRKRQPPDEAGENQKQKRRTALDERPGADAMFGVG
jgi:hypothetical protein